MENNPFLETQRNVTSFVLRFTQDLWQDENGEPKVQWRGHINHVQGDEEIPFTDFKEALQFIQKQLQQLTQHAFPNADAQTMKKLLAESAKIWEQFAADYSNQLVKTMELAIQQSQELQGQAGDAFARAFETWFPPGLREWMERVQETSAPKPSPAPSENPSDLAEQLKTLTAQIDALNAKIEALKSPKK